MNALLWAYDNVQMTEMYKSFIMSWLLNQTYYLNSKNIYIFKKCSITVSIALKLCRFLKRFHQSGKRVVRVSQTKQYFQKQEQFIYKYTLKIEIIDISSIRIDWQ